MEVKAKGKDFNSEESIGKTNEERLGGDIILSGFSLEPIEMIVIKKIVGNYAKKISEKFKYKEIKVTLKQSKKAKTFLHQVKVEVIFGGVLESSAEHKNLYTALSEALEKAYQEAEHKERTSRQIK